MSGGCSTHRADPQQPALCPLRGVHPVGSGGADCEMVWSRYLALFLGRSAGTSARSCEGNAERRRLGRRSTQPRTSRGVRGFFRARVGCVLHGEVRHECRERCGSDARNASRNRSITPESHGVQRLAGELRGGCARARVLRNRSRRPDYDGTADRWRFYAWSPIVASCATTRGLAPSTVAVERLTAGSEEAEDAASALSQPSRQRQCLDEEPL